MSSVPIVIVGTVQEEGGEEKQVTIKGFASIAGLGVGGGPIIPDRPPGIWGGGNVPMPTPPIANVPGAPGYNPNPPGIWGPPGPWPTPPINFPPGWIGGVPPGGGEHPPLFEWKVGWTPDSGWVVVGVPQFPHPSPSHAKHGEGQQVGGHAQSQSKPLPK